MALIACKECGREVSDKATSCPGCGAPIGVAAAGQKAEPTAAMPSPPAKPKRKTSPAAWVALIALIGGTIWYTQSRGYKEQALPVLPVEVKYREAMTGPGLVLHVKNQTEKALVLMVKMTNPTTKQSKNFRLDLSPKGSTEVGYKEGWTGASGDQLELFNDAYQTWKGSFP